MTDEMFCFQCQETVGGKACTKRGVCGKTSGVSNLQNAAIYIVKGLAFWNTHARSLGAGDNSISHFNIKTLFATITNANFDDGWFVNHIKEGLELKRAIATKLRPLLVEKHGKDVLKDVPAAAVWDENVSTGEMEKLIALGFANAPNAEENVDIRSLKELTIIGLKGLAAYADHAAALNYEDDDIFAFIDSTLADTLRTDLTVESWVGIVLKTGEYGVKGMALLDKANTTTFGNPEPTEVNLGVKPGPGILISGHDLLDLKELLEQTEGKGINIYTHGEMLPANAYPELKKFSHLAGNYGSSWWHQGKEFASFNGPILLTTNCLVPPKKSYLHRLFTTGNVGWTGATHIAEREIDKQKDFGEIVKLALTLPEPTELEQGTIPIGFAHNSVLSVAGKVIEGVKSGVISRFVVMAGCDGRTKSRNYYTEVAEKLPADSIILTAGCAKYRYNKLGLGDIGGIPRVLDAGQCNDSYSLAVIALELAKAFDLESINDLPLSFDIAWYEQKAVIVLLALLHLGVKKIRLGPTLPAFLSENVAKVLIEQFDLKGITTADSDVSAMMAGN